MSLESSEKIEGEQNAQRSPSVPASSREDQLHRLAQPPRPNPTRLCQPDPVPTFEDSYAPRFQPPVKRLMMIQAAARISPKNSSPPTSS